MQRPRLRRAGEAARLRVLPPPRRAEPQLRRPSAAIDWDKLGFGLTPTAAMYVATCEQGGKVSTHRLGVPSLFSLTSWQWTPGALRPYGPLEVSPAAGVLNYGQGLFEGMKAYRTVTGRIVLFRPDQARRLSSWQPSAL